MSLLCAAMLGGMVVAEGGSFAIPGTDSLLALLALQVTLGISTLLLHVPVVLGVAHQGVASLVLCAALWSAHALHR